MMFEQDYREKFDAIVPDRRFRRQLEERISEMNKGRKKVGRPVCAAIVLAVMLMLTAAGLATGVFHSIFSRMQEEETMDYAHMDAVSEKDLYSKKIRFDCGAEAEVRLEQSYYNGMQLALGWAVGDVVSRAEIIEGNDARAAQIERTEVYLDLSARVGEEMAKAFYERRNNEGWAGIAWYDVYLSDQVYLAGAPLDEGDDGRMHVAGSALFYPETTRTWEENGLRLSYEDYETPLPEDAQERQSVGIARKISAMPMWYIENEDGAFIGYGEAERIEISFEVPRSEDFQERTHTAERTYDCYSAEVTLSETPIKAELAVENKVCEEWEQIWDGYSGYLNVPLGLSEDVVFDYEVWTDDGSGPVKAQHHNDKYSGVHGLSGWFSMPEGTKRVIFRPVYANTGTNEQNDIIIELE